MTIFRLPWGLTGALLASTYLHSICASASPAINVELKASFSSGPYLLELLETAADENATAYFPLLDRIADGYFSKATTDEELYNQFIQVLKDDGHMNLESLSSYKFALSMRSSAPRIEAHYQYYHTAAEPSLKAEQDTSCPTWVLFNDKQYCSPSLESAHGDVSGEPQTQELPFDRVLGNPSSPASILYTDITSPTFALFHNALARTAREGKTSYRVRHRKGQNAEYKPLIIPGYGVELALKRTDYIVIDDREAATTEAQKAISESEVKFEDGDVADLKPLSTSELFSLSLKASSYIMQSDDPLDTLVKLSQDFPKYSSAVAAHNASEDFLKEHEYNRAQLVPAGFNVWWTNGIQMVEREIEALSLLDLLRRERKLINGFRDIGLTGVEAVQLLGHNEISGVKAENEAQRFDWRDDIEGGNVIIWMNDIEKDKRYEDWPSSLQSMLQRTYPGQLPAVRKDVFNMIVPLDFSHPGDIETVTDVLQSFVKRKISIRFGLVPLTETGAAADQAKVVYHLLETYGLSSAITYLTATLEAKKFSAPSNSIFQEAIGGKKVRMDKIALSLEGVLAAETYTDRLEASQKWVSRLAANSEIPPFFVDGVALPRNENWLQSMSTRVSTDLQAIQNGVYSDVLKQEQWIPTYFLFQAATRRNPLVVPEDEKTLKIIDVNKLVGQHEGIYETLPRLVADPSTQKAEWAHMVFVTDLATEEGWKFLLTMMQFREAHPSVEVTIVHSPASVGDGFSVTDSLFSAIQDRQGKPFESIEDLKLILKWDGVVGDSDIRAVAGQYWQAAEPLVRAMTLAPGEHGILLNGRLVGPIPDPAEFILEDFVLLLTYERAHRISPPYAAMEAMDIADKMSSPLAGAKISSMVTLSSISDVPEGMFEKASNIRMTQFDMWNGTHTAIETGDESTASIHINALVDPASEQGQRWIPILKVLSELDGVYLRLFLNPKERLQELPVKRFFRYVLDSKPTFDDAGALGRLGASFRGVPQEALLTVGLDIPPAWLVAPKASAHDLDNIKLSSIKADVNALYELEHILIEGHSREIPSGAAPRGAQLVLATATNPHFADTIIMANLGYFQFKANPGLYKINLQEGRSAEIFHIDSLGSKGWRQAPGDDSTVEVVLMSFQGTTLYPRLSRKAGMETEDVLGAKVESKMDFVSRGLNFAQGILSGKGKDVAEKEQQADINIFSVASGHLYERMLNIMMVSVMKNTKHTVKFWFIEQFLSPSFKDFIPYLAAEYGFKYEMVTYKWPHWLRAQTEKQREIWGYKILFLDVLFPLSLDKVIFVDADQIVRTDMINLVNHDLQGAPYGFTPMCDSRTEMEGFRFWKQGYWKNFLRGLPYHISALYVVDLHRFRQIAAGDRLRQQYHQLSADPNSLSNLDQDLPNHMQSVLPIHSLPQEWLWCETWCSDESQAEAKTIDLCNNPLTKEPKLDRARRQVPEWTMYDDEIAAVDRKRKGEALEEVNTKSRNHEEAVSTKKDEL